MSKGICKYPVVACRREANERSEMVTQLLYGEHYEVLENTGEWMHIKSDRDNYESWIDNKLHTAFTNNEEDQFVLPFPFNSMKNKEGVDFLLPGASLVGRSIWNNSEAGNLIQTALSYKDAPYLWGGRTSWGIDCSGFVQVVYQIHGMDISRDAYQQAELGEAVEFNALIEPGDLAFFSKEEEKISHVGICLGDEKIIHASGKVRIDKLDHHGIYNSDLNKYTHELRLLKRIKKAV
jgi:hypothetical protein